MSRKDLQRKLKSITTEVPSLIGHYKSATRKIFGVKIDVGQYTYEGFRRRSVELKAMGISERDYAYGVLTILKSWAEDKKLRQLPTNVFLGKWALEKYTNVKDSEFVDFHYDDNDEGDLLYTELLVAKYYIERASSGFVRFRDCVEELRPTLDVRWLQLYDSNNRQDLVFDAIEVLEEEYNVTISKSYTDFVDVKVLNG